MHIFDQLSERRRLVIAQRLRRLPVWGHPALRVRFRSEGFDSYVFGCRAGPSLQFSHLAHELAHAVQFGAAAFEQRLLSTGRYRFGCRQLEVAGQMYDEPTTDECTRRETETFAIQLHLMEMVGGKTYLPAFKKRVAETLEFLPDWYNTPRETRVMRIGELLDSFYGSWSKDRVVDELLAWLDLQAVRMRDPSARQFIGEADIFFTGTASGGSSLAAPRPARVAAAV